jgi:hypothetical protein
MRADALIHLCYECKSMFVAASTLLLDKAIPAIGVDLSQSGSS